MTGSSGPSGDVLPPAVLTDRVPRRRLLAWASYDWGSAAFNAVITTFVFSTYLSTAVASPDSRPSGATWIALSNVVTAVVIALFAAVVGQRADRLGQRRRTVLVCSVITWIAMLAMFFVRPEHQYLLLGLALLGIGNIAMEIGGSCYNAMLQQVSTPDTVGRVSGFGWAMGYLGGIVLLALCFVGFIAPDVGWFGVTSEDGLNIRAVTVFAAIWFVIFGLPLFRMVPESLPNPEIRATTIAGSYRKLFADLRVLWRTDRNAVKFLIASALYRDGLAAVFQFGAILAASVYGLSASNVLIFGIAANVVAAAGALLGGVVEDRVGSRAVVLTSIVAMVLAGGALMFQSGQTSFWIFGLLLCLWVGPAQSSSRTLLTRLAPAGHEGQMFGMYTTTGRAVSFLAPGLFALAVLIGGADRWGIIGIIAVLAAGGCAMLAVRDPRAPRAVPGEQVEAANR